MRKQANKAILVSTFVFLSLALFSQAVAQGNVNPTVSLSSDSISFFNEDQDHIEVTIKNNDIKSHTFTISVFPATFEGVSPVSSKSHVTLNPQQSETFTMSFSSLFEAEFIPRKFSITAAAVDDAKLSGTKDIFVEILKRSPIFVLSLNTDKFSYLPGDTLNVTYVVANNGGDNYDPYNVQTTISRRSQTIKRFESPISFLAEKSKNIFSNEYTFEQFSEPGTYLIKLALKNGGGQIISVKSVKFTMEEVSKMSREETKSNGILDFTTEITSKNEGNSPTDIKMTSLVGSMSEGLFESDVKPVSMEKLGADYKVTWLFEQVQPGEEVKVIYKIIIWKIWLSILIISIIGYSVFRFVLRLHVSKRTSFRGEPRKDKEISVSIEIVNRSINQLKNVVVKEKIPAITSVMSRFDCVKPSIHKTSKGTELVWKFDSLRPGETRIVAYRIKPKMDILGSLKVNPTDVTYSKMDGSKKSVSSGVLTVKK